MTVMTKTVVFPKARCPQRLTRVAKANLQRLRRKRLSAYEFSQIIVEKLLLAFAHMQKNEGKTDIAEFIVNRGAKVVNDTIQTAWETEGAKAAEERMAKSRMEILHKA